MREDTRDRGLACMGDPANCVGGIVIAGFVRPAPCMHCYRTGDRDFFFKKKCLFCFLLQETTDLGAVPATVYLGEGAASIMDSTCEVP